MTNSPIVIHSFCSLFSGLEQTHCVHVACDSEWDYILLQCIFLISTEVVYLLAALFGCFMAGATWNAAVSGQVLRTPFNHPQFTVSLHSKPHRLGVCVFSCYLLSALLAEWPDLLRATAVTQGWNGYQNKSWHRKLTLEKKILLPLLPGLKPRTFLSWVRHS